MSMMPFWPWRSRTGRLTTEPLEMGTVVYEAIIEVTEDGTEAAAGNGTVGNTNGSGKSQKVPKIDAADRPILVAIRHATSGSVLFLGRVAQP